MTVTMISATHQSANRHEERAVTRKLTACMCQPASHSLDLPFLDESIYARLRDKVMKILIHAMTRQTYQSVQAIGRIGMLPTYPIARTDG